jgi:hypothetical protein
VTYPPHDPSTPDPSSPHPSTPYSPSQYPPPQYAQPPYAPPQYAPPQYSQPHPGGGQDAAAYGAGHPPAEPVPPKRGRGKAIAIGATAGGLLLLGGAGFAVAAYLSGGGPQPESVLPRDTIGFVKLDLDPAAGQKTAVMSLLDKFPALENVDDDLKGSLVDEVLQQSGADLSYAEDVEPWLGDRLAVAAVPFPGSEAGVAPVLVAAVTDQQAMADTLDRVRDEAGGEFGFAVRDDFVLVTQSQELADDLAAAEDSLEDDGDYTGDRDALGGDHIALGWADLTAFQSILAQDPEYAEATESLGLFSMGLAGDELGGRAIIGVHAEDDALEIEGLDFGVSDLGTAGQVDEPSRLVGSLPEDSLAAFGLGGAGEQAVKVYDQLQASGMLEGLEQEIARLGITLPDDLRSVFGTDLAIAVRGTWESPAFGARVATDDPQRAMELANELLGNQAGVPTFNSPVEGGYVIASDPDTADVIGGEGGLGGSEAFQRAVADPEDAVVIMYVDIASVVDQMGQPAAEGFGADDLEPLEAVGFSSRWTDEGGHFLLRITTR